MIETGKEMIEGNKKEINGVTYIIPTLGGKAYRVGKAFDRLGRLQDEFKNVNPDDPNSLQSISSECMEDLYILIYYAFERNYPGVTQDEIDRLVDLDDAMDIFPMLVTRKTGEVKEGLKKVAEKNVQA